MEEEGIAPHAAAPMRQTPSRLSLRQASNSGRRRSPSAKSPKSPLFVSPAPPEVISSLINSLSAISQPVEEHFSGLPRINDPPERQEATLAAQASRQSLRASEQAAAVRALTQQQQPQQHGWGMDYGAYKRREEIVDEYDSEDDGAPPPPMRMVKGPTPVKSRTSSKHSSSSMLAYRTSQTSVGATKSQHSLRESDGQGFGMPSIERRRSNSSPSLASSTDAAQNHELRRKRSRDGLRERVNGVKHQDDVERPRTSLLNGAAKLLKPIQSRHSLKNEDASATHNTSPRPATARAATSRGSGLSLSSFTNAASPGSSHSATGQGALNGHLIPSRRSSLRYSLSGSAREDDQKRFSLNLDDMAIDQSLIDQDHSTVKRIRELQEAREKRQKEWRKDSKKSNKSKQNSSSFSRSTRRPVSRQSSHLSIAEVPPAAEATASESFLSEKTQRDIPKELKSPERTPITSTPISSPPRVSSRPSDSRLTQSTNSNVPVKRQPPLANGVSNLPSKPFGRVEDEVEAFLDAPRLRQTIRHPHTGRLITFSDVGDPNGFAVICCVGMGLTRYLTAFYDELAMALKLRLITPDRPGIGESEPCLDGTGTPLSWPDDVELICDHLGIVKFSLLAHSAGALYALATALRMPQRTRGRVHLLAPWITPSQMRIPALSNEPSPAVNIPFSQKILSILPASFLKAANASFFSVASASIAKSPKPSAQRRSLVLSREKPIVSADGSDSSTSSPPAGEAISCYQATNNALASQGAVSTRQPLNDVKSGLSAKQHRAAYDAALTPRIWSLATTNAHPAVDLIICLEKYAPIGFLYTDITRAVVIHHGSRDTRVPVDNVRWLANRMKRCELRVLEGETHGLMASASVMAEILSEIGGEWDEWAKVVNGKKGRRKGMRPGEYALDFDFDDEDEEVNGVDIPGR